MWSGFGGCGGCGSFDWWCPALRHRQVTEFTLPLPSTSFTACWLSYVLKSAGSLRCCWGWEWVFFFFFLIKSSNSTLSGSTILSVYLNHLVPAFQWELLYMITEWKIQTQDCGLYLLVASFDKASIYIYLYIFIYDQKEEISLFLLIYGGVSYQHFQTISALPTSM